MPIVILTTTKRYLTEKNWVFTVNSNYSLPSDEISVACLEDNSTSNHTVEHAFTNKSIVACMYACILFIYCGKNKEMQFSGAEVTEQQ